MPFFRRFFAETSFVELGSSLEAASFPVLPEGWSCRVFGEEDAGLLRRFQERTGVPQSYLDAALARGDAGVGCFRRGELAAWFWIHVDRSLPARVLDRSVPIGLEEGAAYLHHLFVLPEHRPQGLAKEDAFRLVTLWTRAEARRRGFALGVVWVLSDNTVSLRIHLKTGWRVRRAFSLFILGKRAFSVDAFAPSFLLRCMSRAAFFRRSLALFLPGRWADAFFPRGWLLEGPAREDGAERRVLYLGEPSSFHNTALRLFRALPAYRPLGRRFFASAASWCRQLEADLCFARVPSGLARWSLPAGGAAVPELLGAVVDASVADGGHKVVRMIRKHAAERGWTADVARGPDEFYRFYHFNYLPSARRKFGADRYEMPFEQMRPLMREGFLLRVREGERVLGRFLCIVREGRLAMLFSGVEGGAEALTGDGVLAAGYYFALLEARSRGLKEVDVGRCRPFFADGIFGHKRRWAMRAGFDPRRSLTFHFWPDLSRPSARRFLLRNPFVAWTSQGLEARFFYDPAAVPRRDFHARCLADYQVAGLARWRDVPLPLLPAPREVSPRPASHPFLSGFYGGVLSLRRRSLGREDHDAFYRRAPWMPLKALRALQDRKLADLLDYARRSVPHFRDLLADGAPDPSDRAAFRRLPLMDRRDMSLHEGRYRGRDGVSVAVRVTTSGTSAHPTALWVDLDSILRRQAVVDRGRAWWGLRRGDPHVKVWGRFLSLSLRRSLRERWGENVRLFNAYRLDEEQARRIWDSLTLGGSAYVYGYASALAELALSWDARGRRLAPGGLACVISTAEAMSPAEERLVEAVFGAPVVREYGSTEFNEIAFECPDGGMHINVDRLLVEFIADDGRPARPGEPARIVVTDLDNRATPLIRYPLGDRGSYTDEPCACGRTLPLLKDLWGREGDFLLLPGGGRSHATVLSAAIERAFDLCGLPCLPWQVIQKSPSRMEVVLHEGARSPLLEARVRETLAFLDPGLCASFVYLPEFPRTPNGKRNRFIRGFEA